MQKTIPLTLAIVLVAVFAAAGFYGGTVYGKGKNSDAAGFQRNGNFAMGQNAKIRNGQNRGGFINGNIIKQDATSITVAVQGGGSKTVYLSASSTVGRIAEGKATDLKIGDRVMVNGMPNADGSVVAQMIQIRPEGETNFGGANGRTNGQ